MRSRSGIGFRVRARPKIRIAAGAQNHRAYPGGLARTGLYPVKQTRISRLPLLQTEDQRSPDRFGRDPLPAET